MGLLADWQMAAVDAATNPRHYIWWFPGSPVRVHVDLRVVEGLQNRLREPGHDSSEHRLLVGRVVEGATEILEFRSALGRSVPEIILELSSDPTKHLVGYYRTAEALRLNAQDLSLFKTFFDKPYHVFLVMQPNGFAAPNATFFFFSQGNHKVSDFPFLEFPLDASQLAIEERDRISRCRLAADRPFELPQASPPPKPAAMSRRPRVFRAITIGVFATAALLFPALSFTNPTFRERLAQLLNTFWNETRQARLQFHASPSSSATTRPRIGLQVKRQAADLELDWDHQSPVITAAISGSFSIQDGFMKHELSLDAQQLRGQTILYTPVSDEVLIQLTVTAPDGSATESIRVIRRELVPTYALNATRPQPAYERDPVVFRAYKAFTAPPVAQKPSAPLSLNDPPTISGNLEPTVDPGLASYIQPSVRPSVPMAVPVQDTPASVSQTSYSPPVPLKKVAPGFPSELKALPSKPTVVSIRVLIDKSGRVQKAEPLPHQNVHQFFVAEALRAAQFWKFKPAQLGDVLVSSESVLRFSFNP